MSDAAAERAELFRPLLPRLEIRDAFEQLVAHSGLGVTLTAAPRVSGVFETSRRGLLVLQCVDIRLGSTAERDAAGEPVPVEGVDVAYCLLFEGSVVPFVDESEPDDAVAWSGFPDAEEIARAAEALGGKPIDLFVDSDGEDDEADGESGAAGVDPQTPRQLAAS
jgi:hypothetical protein